MKVLVTGASGFLGFHLLNLLQEMGAEIHTLDVKPSHLGIQHNVSLADAFNLRKILIKIEPDYIVHLAGIAVAPDIQTYYAVNTGFAANLLWALKDSGNSKLSCDSYGYLSRVWTYIE